VVRLARYARFLDFYNGDNQVITILITDRLRYSRSNLSLNGMTEENSTNEGAVPRVYEIGYHIVPTVVSEDLPREVTALKDFLDKEGSVIIAEEFPKLRPLSYEIRKLSSGAYQKYNSAYFGWIKFEGPSEAIKRIETGLTAMGNILRFILIKTVRESTLVSRTPRQDTRKERKEAPKEAVPSAPISETELDKSLEKIIAE